MTAAPLPYRVARHAEEDLCRLTQAALNGGAGAVDDAALTALCERAIGNHDPCISCSTHFLDLTVEHT